MSMGVLKEGCGSTVVDSFPDISTVNLDEFCSK